MVYAVVVMCICCFLLGLLVGLANSKDTKRMDKFEDGVMITREDKLVAEGKWKYKWVGRHGFDNKLYAANTARKLLDQMINSEQ